jgi:hypothetical protein
LALWPKKLTKPWLELLSESGVIKVELTRELLTEARELAAIFTASQQTAKRLA